MTKILLSLTGVALQRVIRLLTRDYSLLEDALGRGLDNPHAERMPDATD